MPNIAISTDCCCHVCVDMVQYIVELCVYPHELCVNMVLLKSNTVTHV